MNKKKRIIVLVLASLLLTIAVALAYLFTNDTRDLMDLDSSAVDWKGKQKSESKEFNDSIAIPGFSELVFIANERTQQVNFFNPEINDCYFKLTLLTENGETLWRSDLIEPGKGLYSIELLQNLPEGQHENAVLKYECFTLDEDQSPLNGSEINLTIHATQI